ncbi:MAG: V-type ATP synthase subunit E [Chlamydiales bacterium]|nr:V-type ATP synthase subunit E [Chlamydiales bacterium]
MMDQQHPQDKVKKICDALKAETLDPAKREAEALINESKRKAKEIVDAARAEGEALIAHAEEEIVKKRATAESALRLAARQTIEALKQKIESQFFNRELTGLVETELQKSDVIAKLIETVVNAIEKEGVEANLEAIVPKVISAEEVNKALGKAIIERLKSKGVILGDIKGGAEVKLIDKHITLDITDEALCNLLADYIRDDFRELIFSGKN